MSSYAARLLEPRGAGKKSQQSGRSSPASQQNSRTSQQSSPSTVANGPRNGSDSPVPSATSMYEKLHGVQDRSDAPSKRRKIENEGGPEGANTKMGRYASGGDVSEEIKKGRREAKFDPRNVVDLTAEEDKNAAADNDVQLLSHTTISNDKEVCIGRVSDAKVSAHRVPSPKMSTMNTQTSWPAMRIELNRMPGSSSHIIRVSDPTGKDFGNVDPRTAKVLAPLMDSVKTSKIRWVSRLNMRNKKPYEFPGQSISTQYDITVVLYCPKRMANGIGKLFSQQGIFLRDPMGIIDRNVDYYNPQAPKDYTPKDVRQPLPTTSRYTSGASTVIRTAEQVRNDVINIMDSLTKTSILAETEPPPVIKTELLPHQKQALTFMADRETDKSNDPTVEDESSLWKEQTDKQGNKIWYNVITGHSTRRKPDPVLGGILADVMGLGKTLSVLSLVSSTLDACAEFETQPPPVPEFDDEVKESELKFNSRATLLICPLSTVANWEEQIARHLRPRALKWEVYHGTKRTNNAEELTDNDLIITTYSVVAADSDKRSRLRPNNPLAEINWFRIVLDEAHLIREVSTKQSKSVCSLTAQRRWAVTGTPVQNRLSDLGALFKFLRIRPFDEPRYFTQYIESPFKSANPEILSHLRVLVDSITLRRLKDKLDLPSRSEEIVHLEFSTEEKRLYDQFKRDDKTQEILNQSKIGGTQYANILRAITRLRLICAHGQDLLSEDDYNLAKGYSTNNPIDLEDEKKARDMSPRQAFDLYRMMRDAGVNVCSKCNVRQIDPPETSDYDLDEEEEAEDEPFGYITPCNHLICPDCRKSFKKDFSSTAGPDGYAFCSICEAYSQMSLFVLRPSNFFADEAAKAEVLANPKLAKHHGRYSGPHSKVKALLENLEIDNVWSDNHKDQPRVKSVIFSGWTTFLDLIQIAFVERSINFRRLDGQMSRTQRRAALDEFASEPEVECILVSLTAGGLGLNLTSACRVYMMEPQFNPAAEAQAVERVHRLGQTREVKILKFIMKDSIEGGILRLQDRKKNLASMSMDKQKTGESRDAVSERMKDLRSLFK